MTYTFILQQFIFSPRLTLTFILHTKTKERGRSERKAWTRWKRANLIIVTYYWTDCPFHWLTHCWISRLLISSSDPPWPCHLSLSISSPLPLDQTTDPPMISLSLSLSQVDRVWWMFCFRCIFKNKTKLLKLENILHLENVFVKPNTTLVNVVIFCCSLTCNP